MNHFFDRFLDLFFGSFFWIIFSIVFLDRFFGIERFAKELREGIIKESGLPISVGLSQNKVVSKIATGEVKPDAMSVIRLGEEKQFLAPLDVNKIPMIGNKTFQLLMGLGVYKVKTLQEMPVEVLEGVLVHTILIRVLLDQL